ncbi:ABC transporter permease [Oleispirillum naphthae]|uniref:ABC transporter permease n=1 Tax=Oleispirillum naphthae TaxID=2838853 RepID=UPI0030825C20
MSGFPLFRLALRDLKGGFANGFSGFRVLLAGLALGVAAVAAAGSVVSSVEAGLARDARVLLGGDVEASRLYRPPDAAERAALERLGRVSEIAEARVMARRPDGTGRALLTELKAVDRAYPLAGALRLDPPLPPARAFAADEGGEPGVAVAQGLLARLGLAVGDSVRIGNADFRIRARILAEPDSASRMFSLGPRAITDFAGLQATGLVQPGSLITYAARLAAPGLAAAAVQAALPDQAWRVRGLDNAAPGTRRFLDTIARFLAWAGLSALLVGGVGVASAVSAVLDARRPVLAVLKSQGATNRQIVALHAIVIGAVAAVGILAGLVIGAAAPWPVAALIGQGGMLPAAPLPALYPLPLARAAAFGALTAALFAWLPLLRAREVPAAALFQDVSGERASPISPAAWAVLAALLAALLALAAASGDRPELGLGFAAGAAAVLGLLRLAAAGISAAAARCHGAATGVLGRLALANLARRRGPLAPMMTALGLGATVLVTLTQVQGNVSAQVGSERGDDRPSYFFIDIQPDQASRFAEIVAAIPGAAMEDSAPMVRGRVVALKGRAADPNAVDPAVRWVLAGDRGFTAAARPPRGADIVAGSWWQGAPGKPQVSVEKGVADGLGLSIGDSVTVNILGREITATVASLRAVRWTSLSMNFAFVFSPGVIDAAPHTRIATVKAPPEGELPLERAVAAALPNVSAIRVADVLERVQGLSDVGARAVLAVTGVTVLAGLLVLGGAVSAGLRERLDQAVVLKVLGARRRELMRVTAWEFLGIGAITGAFAIAAGSAAAWAVVRLALRLEWTFRPGAAILVAALAAAAGLATGGLIAGRVLAARPARRLRHL